MGVLLLWAEQQASRVLTQLAWNSVVTAWGNALATLFRSALPLCPQFSSPYLPAGKRVIAAPGSLGPNSGVDPSRPPALLARRQLARMVPSASCPTTP